ncbi:MAG: HAD family hydrolase [Candidatus Hermodarchaeota archaeon]
MTKKLCDKIKAILFDLDKTLLEIDLEKFVQQYLMLLAQSVAPLNIPPKKFISKILEASKAVERNNGHITNEEVYAKNFFPLEGYSREEIEPYFDEFYKNRFQKLKQFSKQKPEAREIIQTAFDRGYDVVIATMPILPRTAIEQRLEWAGIADFPYRLITTIENSCSTKSLTHLIYYEQIVNRLGYTAENCLMVGDEGRDIIAGRLGMKTFLIANNSIKLGPEIPEPTFKGTLSDLKLLL